MLIVTDQLDPESGFSELVIHSVYKRVRTRLQFAELLTRTHRAGCWGCLAVLLLLLLLLLHCRCWLRLAALYCRQCCAVLCCAWRGVRVCEVYCTPIHQHHLRGCGLGLGLGLGAWTGVLGRGERRCRCFYHQCLLLPPSSVHEIVKLAIRRRSGVLTTSNSSALRGEGCSLWLLTHLLGVYRTVLHTTTTLKQTRSRPLPRRHARLRHHRHPPAGHPRRQTREP
ncbi:uncharacterized protein BO72DRAFT_117896 [Aspergillus fijiensis CBS 313.89]|uniref:Uncharacterized protein n=1 Tax=Aspergillus fijiensis CBS 313.89 TaxID=1448319 RepID=A0A8G1VXT4_9EURO|nr:uncharacterized protein BO72DRAFT_117896 [Aspergillus fijiensis CBS 313.89]RAK76995.1 hypothetical protein BO72DRAFT_117896 [Aspergillus fijiensis CBS 313.89]